MCLTRRQVVRRVNLAVGLITVARGGNLPAETGAQAFGTTASRCMADHARSAPQVKNRLGVVTLEQGKLIGVKPVAAHPRTELTKLPAVPSPDTCALNVGFRSKADRLYMNAARRLRPAQRTNAQESLNVRVGPVADTAIRAGRSSCTEAICFWAQVQHTRALGVGYPVIRSPRGLPDAGPAIPPRSLPLAYAQRGLLGRREPRELRATRPKPGK